MLDRSSVLLFELSLWLNAGAIKGLIVIAACFIRFVPMHSEGGAWRKAHAKAHLQVPLIPLNNIARKTHQSRWQRH